MPGGGRVKQCLTENIEKLAPACQAAVSAHAAEPAKK
jgi:hypothetical protein